MCKGIYAEIAYFAKNTCIKNINIEDISTKGIYTRSAYIRVIGDISIKNTYIGSICIRVINDASTKGVCTERAYIQNTLNDVVKYLEIHLKLFWILKMKLFGTRLKI